MPDLNGAFQTHLPHNPVESHRFHLRMLGNLTKMKATTSVRSQPHARSDVYWATLSSTVARGSLSTNSIPARPQTFDVHLELEEADESEGEPDSGTRRE